ncbi:hypothetical protein YC2023_029474 [Brassica napus]
MENEMVAEAFKKLQNPYEVVIVVHHLYQCIKEGVEGRRGRLGSDAALEKDDVYGKAYIPYTSSSQIQTAVEAFFSVEWRTQGRFSSGLSKTETMNGNSRRGSETESSSSLESNSLRGYKYLQTPSYTRTQKKKDLYFVSCWISESDFA